MTAAALCAVSLAACGAAPQDAAAPTVPAFIAAEIEPGPDGRCYGRDITPALIETVTEQVLDQPARHDQTGALVRPASYRTVIRQQMTRERREVSFETLCPPAYTPEFVSSLQRALQARGVYSGPISGVMDAPPAAPCRITSAATARTARFCGSARRGRSGLWSCRPRRSTP